jgi:hypothetical protein
MIFDRNQPAHSSFVLGNFTDVTKKIPKPNKKAQARRNKPNFLFQLL